MTRDGSTFARWAMRRMVAASKPRSPNSARAASRMRCAVAARFAALLLGSLTPFTLPLLSEWGTVGSTGDERGRDRSDPPSGARSSHGSTSRQDRSAHRRVTRAGLRASAEYLARGWQVTATVRGAGRAGLHDLARSSGGRLAVETVDITVPEQVAALHERLAQVTFDLLFVNAGVTNGPGETVADVSTD